MSSPLKDARFNYAAVRLFTATGVDWGEAPYGDRAMYLVDAQVFFERNPQAIRDWASDEATIRAFG